MPVASAEVARPSMQQKRHKSGCVSRVMMLCYDIATLVLAFSDVASANPHFPLVAGNADGFERHQSSDR